MGYLQGYVRDSKVLKFTTVEEHEHSFSFNMTNTLEGWRVDIMPLENEDIPSIHVLVQYPKNDTEMIITERTTRLYNESRVTYSYLPINGNWTNGPTEPDPSKNDTEEFETIGYYSTNVGYGDDEYDRVASIQILREN